jgi:hypothetical protein
MADLIGDLGDPTKDAAALKPLLDRALLALAAGLRGAAQGIEAYLNVQPLEPPK